jgi:RNA polymerase sigma factor (TIGR02999 family)
MSNPDPFQGFPPWQGYSDQPYSSELFRAIYDRLRALAQRKMGHERRGHTLQATALVHEAILRLVAGRAARAWDEPRHFYAAAAEAMRCVLIDAARRHRRVKRGGGGDGPAGGHAAHLNVDELPTPVADAAREEILALDEALAALAAEDPRKAELVKLRYFGGLTNDETAQTLGISAATVDRHWAYARAWLYRWLTSSDRPAAVPAAGRGSGVPSTGGEPS